MGAEERDPALAALREQLEGAQDAARRLAREAAEAGLRARRPPPGGWSSASGPAGPPSDGELTALLELAGQLREAIPVELWERLVAVVRELLLAVRALLDYAVDQLEERRATPVEVQDIPIV